jgi:dCMP deaminase
MRPDWDSYFMKIAYAVSERSTCERAYVGSVLVLDKRILTTGFNGSPAGQPHCDEIGHLLVDGHCLRTIHAETNAIIQAALHGVSTRGSTCYVTHFPCINCSKALINAGIARLVYHVAYRIDENAMGFLRAADIEIVHLNNDALRFSDPAYNHSQRPDENADW